MAYDIFSSYGLDKVHDSAEGDYKDSGSWTLIKTKSVRDSDGFMTDYSWYTDGSKHIFMFGDTDLIEPDEDYADWIAESEKEASDWFETYNGFEDEDEYSLSDLEEYDEEYEGNADFLNDGFDNIYGDGLELED